MPPIPADEVAPDEQLCLTDQDVDILYQIITRAEQQPDVEHLPFRAIFTAYEAVLSENGIDTDRDQTYFRFLFQLGDRKWRGQSLYQKFEALLLRLGIRLDYGDGEIPEADQSGQVAVDAGVEAEQTQDVDTGQLRVNGHSRPRRASFNSMYDAANETTQRSIRRPGSSSSVSRLELKTRASSASPSTRREKELFVKGHRPSAGFRDVQNNIPPIGHGDQISAQFAQQQPPRLPTNGLHVNSRPEPANWVQRGQFTADSDEDYVRAVESASSDDQGIARPELPAELHYRPSLPHLLRDASTFNEHRLRATIRQLLAQWTAQATRQQVLCNDMEQVAIRRDTMTLSRQAFDIWRGQLHNKRQQARTERFFRHLEKRAARARDLYLLTKAFTHWAQVAADEVERTSAARRHILCIKYFNAWREITAVNELKIQRFLLKKPFRSWRAKLAQIERDEVSADTVYQTNLMRRAYRCWFLSFCNIRAPQYRDYHLKRRSLISWLRALRTQREWDHDIDSNNKQVQLEFMFGEWSRRSREIAQAQHKADHEWKLKLVQQAMSEWRVQARLQPIAVHVSNQVDSRILRAAANTWAMRTRMERQSREYDRIRIMRNTWTAWNDRLRWQALSARIDERLAMRALCKWLLMERFSLLTRIREQRLKEDMLNRLMTNSRGLYTRLLRQEVDFRDHRKRESVRSLFSTWRERLAVQRQREHIALEFYAPRVEQESFGIWRGRAQHVSRLEKWATDARYYFLMTKAIKDWRAATVKSSKKRCQDAYAMMRRRLKVASASKSLSAWRSKTAVIYDMERQADDVYQTKLFKRGTDIFDKWSEQSTRRVRTLRDSEIYYNRQLAYSYFIRLVRSVNHLRAQDEKAAQFFDIHVSGLASAQFRKLSLRIFQIRTSIETADALNERNLRKHFRNMFRHWLGKARFALSTRQMGEIDLGAENDRDLDPDPDPDPEAEEWPPIDPTLQASELVAMQTPTPTPGYLNSPSKRAARARALANMSTTPATPMRTPFAARILAQAFNTEPRQVPGRKSVNRRSSLATNVRFAYDEPESPSEGRSTGRLR